ncbi:diguanylate cyclase domain-containing protein [Marinobacterium marinum]|uniref:Diguanylate cyclase n=1 Tax=Marinobacterium marinum TaxID=2756129 RepID=A0A7W1WY56_9GAMM|nr:diguanylate cyclase [Marinobacterium marinum]MBA4502413.1 diguanylate cyclase [Marinobacterium marinum]
MKDVMARSPRKVVTLRGLMRKAQVRSNIVGLITSGIILTVLGLFTLVNLADHNQKLVSRVLSYTLEAAVVFKDREAIGEGIDLIAKTEKLSGVVVLDEHGKVLYEWESADQSRWARLEKKILGLMLDQPNIVSMHHNGKPVGELKIYTDGSIFLVFMLCGFLAVLMSLVISTIGANIEGGRIHGFIYKSVKDLANIARKIARERSFELRAPLSSIHEIRELAEDLNILLDEIETWEGHLKQENDTLSFKARHDALTGILNKESFDKILSNQIEFSREKGIRFALLYIDGYRFKSINDVFGHAAGDEVLVTIAKRLGALIRDQDHLARLGGDEFAILIRPLRNDRDIEVVVEKIVGCMEEPITLDSGETISFSLTIGASIFPYHGENKKDLLHSADEAMYKAKRSEKTFHINGFSG